MLSALFSNIGTTALVILFFGGSIFVHELGHFFAARRRGLKVERFSLGFGPKIWSWRGKDGVEYRISWIPLGGYVALPQLADMQAIEGASETPVEQLPSIDYASKMIVSVAGAAMNVVFAFLLACIIWLIGVPTSSEYTSTRIGYVTPTIENIEGKQVPSPASQAGLQIGDRILSIDGHKLSDWNDIMEALVMSSGISADGRRQSVFTIERDGQPRQITVFPLLSGDEKFRKVGIAPGYELLVHEVTPGTPASQAGLQKQDEILSLDGVRILHGVSFHEYLRDHAAQPVQALVKRGEAEVALTIPARADAKADLGVELTTTFALTHPTPWMQLWEHTSTSFRTLWSLINPRSDIGLSKMAGPVGIVRILHSAAESGLRALLMITILINVSLAIFNLLPIPVLDGGHMLFATIARLRGRPIPVNVIASTQSVFMLLLISMVLYVSFFDVRRWSRDRQNSRPPAAEAPAPAPEPATQPAK